MSLYLKTIFIRWTFKTYFFLCAYLVSNTYQVLEIICAWWHGGGWPGESSRQINTPFHCVLSETDECRSGALRRLRRNIWSRLGGQEEVLKEVKTGWGPRGVKTGDWEWGCLRQREKACERRWVATGCPLDCKSFRVVPKLSVRIVVVVGNNEAGDGRGKQGPEVLILLSNKLEDIEGF